MKSLHFQVKTLSVILINKIVCSFEGGGSNYGLQGMGDNDAKFRGNRNDGESSEPSSSRERMTDLSRRRKSTELSAKEKNNTLSAGTR